MSATSDVRQMNVSPANSGGTTLLSQKRLGIAAVVLAGIVAVVAAVLYLTFALEWRADPFIGAMLNRSMMVDGSRSVTGEQWLGLSAGLRRGGDDFVSAVAQARDDLAADAAGTTDDDDLHGTPLQSEEWRRRDACRRLVSAMLGGGRRRQ